eukprot:4804958-Pleurochrysis_carterae.AAC.1
MRAGRRRPRAAGRQGCSVRLRHWFGARSPRAASAASRAASSARGLRSDGRQGAVRRRCLAAVESGFRPFTCRDTLERLRDSRGQSRVEIGSRLHRCGFVDMVLTLKAQGLVDVRCVPCADMRAVRRGCGRSVSGALNAGHQQQRRRCRDHPRHAHDDAQRAGAIDAPVGTAAALFVFTGCEAERREGTDGGRAHKERRLYE